MMTLGQRLATSLRSVKALVIAPSERIDDIAARHQKHLPRTVRALLRGVGSSSASSDLSGSALASYLLFEAPFTQEVMALGERDTLAQRQAVCRSEEHTSELQSLMRISYAVFCLKKKNNSTATQLSS